MNYLAHAHLSFNYPNIVVGNMISDFIKGKKQFDYPAAIQKGIHLHRAIDTFTDNHPATHQLKQFFKPQYRLYAGAFTDVVYDHFLANDATVFSTDEALQQFAVDTYQILKDNFSVLPEAFKKMVPYMIEHNWLYNYKTKWGLQKSFQGLVRRAHYLAESEIAFQLVNENYNAMRLIYEQFYPEIQKFAAHHLQHTNNH